MGLLREWKKYQASRGKKQLAPKVRDPAKRKKLKKLPAKIKWNR